MLEREALAAAHPRFRVEHVEAVPSKDAPGAGELEGDDAVGVQLEKQRPTSD